MALNSEYGQLQHVLLACPNPSSFVGKLSPIENGFITEPDFEGVSYQLTRYAKLLRSLGIRVSIFIYNQYPNQIFLRDLAFVMDNRVLLANPKLPCRQGEEQVLGKYLQRWCADLIVMPCKEPSFEAADVLYLTPKQLAVAVGGRTSEKAADLSLKQFAALGGASIVKFESMTKDVPQHLLGHKHVVGPEKIIIRPQICAMMYGYHDVVILFEEEEVTREFAMNIVTIKENLIVMPDGCPKTRKLFESKGITCLTTPMDEIHKMGGGLACITLPLAREPV